MKNIPSHLGTLILMLVLCANVTQVTATSFEIKDTIKANTVWNVDTVRVTGNLFLPEEYTLTIEPGTRVEFQGYYAFTYKGSVVAIGAPNDSIIFTINDTSGFHDISSVNGAWKEIKGDGPNNRHSYYEYCIFEYAKNLSGDYAISLGKPNGFNNKFNYNIVQNLYADKSAIYLGTDGVYNCIVRYNLCDAVYASRIKSCHIYNNKGNGVSILLTDNVGDWEYNVGICSDNIIQNNQGFAIKNAVHYRNYITNNLIDNNKGGINIDNKSQSLIINNIISNNLSYGAIKMRSGSSWIFGNLIFKNSNQAIDTIDTISSGIHIFNTGNIKIFNNTIIQNKGINAGGLTLINFTSAKVWNNILWENSSTPGTKEAIFLSDQPELAHTLSLHSNFIKLGTNSLTIQTDIEVDSSNIFSADPKFSDYSAGDYSLISTSPCFNKGRNLSIPEFYDQPLFDLAENYRIMCNIIDIGAYEFEPDSMLVISLLQSDTTLFCDKSYHSAYLRSVNYPNIYDPGPYTYQWQKDGIDIENATFMDLYLENVSENEFGNYRVIVHHWSTRTDVLYFTNTLGKINDNTIDTYLGADTTIVLTNLVDNNLTYQWFKGNQKLEDTTSYLKIKDVKNDDMGYYYCIISNDCSTTYTDSVFLNIVPYCELKPAKDTVLNIAACLNYEFNGFNLTASGTYYDTIPSLYGCDSVIALNLEILTPVTDTIYVTTCGEYNFNGKILTETGIYQTLIPSKVGCDSIIICYLNILNPSYNAITVINCSKYNFHGTELTKSGIYYDTLSNYLSCDSIVTLNLTILEPSWKFIDTTVCNNYEFNGLYLNKSGIYFDTLSNFVGCDSIVKLTLKILQPQKIIIDEIACVSYSFNDKTLTESGVYYDTLVSLNGCDSIVILHLTIEEATRGKINTMSCTDFTFNNKVYTKSGEYIDTLYNETGCYTIFTLNLIIPDLDTSVVNINSGLSAIMPGAEYQWVSCESGYTLIPDATEKNFITQQSGKYAVIVGQNDCYDTSSCHNFIYTNLNEETSDENILVYPNPFSVSTTIETSDQVTVIDEIRVINSIGEELFRSINIPGNIYKLKGDNFPPGAYYIILRFNNKIVHKKIVVN